MAELSGVLIQGSCRIEGWADVISLNYNIESPGNTCDFDQLTDQVNVTTEALALGPLTHNGGPTETKALLPGSVAIDAIPPEMCEADKDQRGVARPQGAACDVGAFETGGGAIDSGTGRTRVCMCAGRRCTGRRCVDPEGVGGSGGSAGAGGTVSTRRSGGSGGSGGEAGTGGIAGSAGSGGARIACDGTIRPCTESGIRGAIAEGGGPFTFACDGPTTVATEAEIVIDNDVILDGCGGSSRWAETTTMVCSR